MKNSIAIVLGISLLACLPACKSKTETQKLTDEIIPVTIMPLQQDSAREAIYASGQFTTEDETNLSFKTSGIINQIYVREGDAVKQGQLLATLHLTEVNAIAEQASLAYEKAERDYQRASNLYRDSVATLEQLQNARTALDVAKQQTTTAGFNRNYSEIRATRSGFVLRKYLNEGQYASAGTAVLQINGAGQQGHWVLKTGVSDYQWAAIRKGDAATITTDALPGRIIPASVSSKSEGIDPASGTFSIQLQLKEKNIPVAAGLFGKATIQASQSSKAWAIPYDALLDGDTNNGYVFVTNDSNTAEKVKVQIARIENGTVLVTGGLERAKALIISGSAYLNSGSKITIRQTTSN